MKQYLRLSLILSLLPASSFAITHAHPAPVHHDEEPTSKVTTTITTTHHEEEKAKPNKIKEVTTTSDKKTTTKVTKQKKERPITESNTKVDNAINSIFSKRGNPSSLDKKQIYTLAKEPSIQGQEALTLAAMILAINNAKYPNKVTFTKSELLAAFNNPDSALSYYFNLALTNINSIRTLPAKQKLFGPGGITYTTQIIQNSDDDCYFLSAINSILQTKGGPEALHNMITPVQGTTDEFDVKFPGDPTVVKVKLTDTEIGMYSQLTTGGQWLAVLSVAEAMRRDQQFLNPEKTIEPGYQTQTYRLMTDKKYTLYTIPTTTLTAKQLQKMQDMITSSLNDNIPIGIETSDHDLSIIGFVNGNIIIKNPWGTSGWYNPTNGDSSNKATMPTKPGPWYLMQDGVFSVPLANVNNGFEDIAYTKEAANNPSANFEPQLSYPGEMTVASFPLSPVVAPLDFTGINQTIKKDNDESISEKPKAIIHCHHDGNDPVGCEN